MIRILYNKAKGTIHRVTNRHLINFINYSRTYLKRDSEKVFGIGRNKTGTTSLMVAMQQMGYIVGDQRTAELLADDWAESNYSTIIRYCKTAEFFQDVPFSYPETFKVLDEEFPGSKFILTVRDSPEQWYRSLTRFHAKLWGKKGRIPTKEDLQNASYVRKGWPWKNNQRVFNTPEDDPYQKDILIQHYIDYNKEVKEYFSDRPEDLLVLNVSKEGSMEKLADFLEKEVEIEDFPWENKT
ncbi:sulfotransferase [Maribellus sediminis]|uniref:sulfotransferase n=1 Tax=Maribellus sediminis TaxID=2696285 RepID=UPI0014313CEF|nr:sulfotransferase [Maribellus sediminis]